MYPLLADKQYLLTYISDRITVQSCIVALTVSCEKNATLIMLPVLYCLLLAKVS